MNKCIYKRYRTLKGYMYTYCTLKHLEGTLKCEICHSCDEVEYKKINKIKKVSKTRVFVSKDTYNSVYNRDKGKCRLCNASDIQLHHIIYRSRDKTRINDISNCIMLCGDCHRLVHSNKDKWQPILLEMNKNEIN